MTPPETVIDAFGGIRRVAHAIGVAPSTVLRWGAEIPGCYVPALLQRARELGVPLTAEQVIVGAPQYVRRVIRRF